MMAIADLSADFALLVSKNWLRLRAYQQLVPI